MFGDREKRTDIVKRRGERNSHKALDLSRQHAKYERETERKSFQEAKESIDNSVSWFKDEKVQEHIRSAGTRANGFRKLYLQYIRHARYYEDCYTNLGNKAFLEPYKECYENITKIERELHILIVIAQVQPAIFAEAARMNPENLENFKDIFKKRIAVETAVAAKYRIERDKDNWVVGKGLYPICSEGGIKELTEELKGDELALHAQVQELLRKRQGNSKPVTLVDFGGGLGLSMRPLAE